MRVGGSTSLNRKTNTLVNSTGGIAKCNSFPSDNYSILEKLGNRVDRSLFAFDLEIYITTNLMHVQ